MAKRSCPFLEEPVQRKIHIGVREVDSGVCGNMEAVYERTKKLLFAGALLTNQDKNSNLIKLPSAVYECNNDLECQELCQPKILRGQCQIDITGRLIPYKKAAWDQSLVK